MLVIIVLTRASYAFSEFFSSFHVCSCALVFTLQSEKDRVGVARLLKWLLGTRFLQSYDIALRPFSSVVFCVGNGRYILLLSSDVETFASTGARLLVAQEAN